MGKLNCKVKTIQANFSLTSTIRYPTIFMINYRNCFAFENTQEMMGFTQPFKGAVNPILKILFIHIERFIPW